VSAPASPPQGWETVPLRRLCESLQTGPFGSQLNAEQYVESGTPVVNPSNLSGGRILPDWTCTVDDDTRIRLSRHSLIAGDMVFGRRGEMGRCAVVTERGGVALRHRLYTGAPEKKRRSSSVSSLQLSITTGSILAFPVVRWGDDGKSEHRHSWTPSVANSKLDGAACDCRIPRPRDGEDRRANRKTGTTSLTESLYTE
jgi:hypothetical protein